LTKIKFLSFWKGFGMPIHPTAIISPRAQIDPTAEIGPYVVIDENVAIGPDCRIGPHVYITGFTTLGAGNHVHAGAVLGDLPQDLAFKDCRSFVRIGDHNVIREGVTIHRGTAPESETVIGNHCYLMAFSHVAHNCRLADQVKLANCALLAGHVQVGEGTFFSGIGGAHQFVRIGRLCMIAGVARVAQDIPPFMMVHGDNRGVGVNRVGLHRAGWTSQQIMDLRAAYRFLYRSRMSFTKRVDQLEKETQSPYVKEVIAFIRNPSKRGIAGPPRDRKINQEGSSDDE
jgi:UDP-N-acetylglucosamine acyltransferase